MWSNHSNHTVSTFQTVLCFIAIAFRKLYDLYVFYDIRWLRLFYYNLVYYSTLFILLHMIYGTMLCITYTVLNIIVIQYLISLLLLRWNTCIKKQLLVVPYSLQYNKKISVIFGVQNWLEIIITFLLLVRKILV